MNTVEKTLLRLVLCEPSRLGTGCWEYPNRDNNGYGRAEIGKVRWAIHRLTYSHFVAPIPAGAHIHHRCGNPACANFEHLALVTRKQHVFLSKNACSVNAAKTHCKNGHALVGGVIRWENGRRRCRICQKQYKLTWQRSSRARKRVR